MSVTLVADAGSPTANSYCTDTEALAYHDKRYLNSVWSDAEKPDREKVLMWATRLLDQQEWKGMKTNYLSGSLRWPRNGCVDRDKKLIDGSVVPQFMKDACAEWAFYLLTEDRTLDEGGLVQYGGKVGPITDPHAYARKSMPDGVREMVSPYLSSGNIASGGRISRL